MSNQDDMVRFFETAGFAHDEAIKIVNELFFYDKDKSPEGQRRTNKPRDRLSYRQDKVVITHPKEYKDVVQGARKDIDGKNPRNVRKAIMARDHGITGPKGKLPEGLQPAEVTTMNKKSDIVRFFEAAGVDITKGKAKQIVEGRRLREGDPCPACGGSGGSKKKIKVTCGECHGQGMIPDELIDDDAFDGERDPSVTEYECGTCNGRGSVIKTDNCLECHGSGVWAPG